MRYSCGFTLLEVMVSLFMLSLVLFGITAAEVKALREARGILYFSRAISLSENMAEYLLVYAEPSGYLSQWQYEVQHDLPDASAAVTGLSPRFTISITWGGYDRVCHQSKAGLSGCVKYTIAA